MVAVAADHIALVRYILVRVGGTDPAVFDVAVLIAAIAFMDKGWWVYAFTVV